MNVSKLTIAIGTDHRGFAHKEFLTNLSTLAGIEITWIDVGCMSAERSDYPPYAQQVCELILTQKAAAGILLCGSGVGMAITANRFPDIFAGVAWNATIARVAREDDHINVLVLPADYLAPSDIEPIVAAWLTARTKGGRYIDRLEMIDAF